MLAKRTLAEAISGAPPGEIQVTVLGHTDGVLCMRSGRCGLLL